MKKFLILALLFSSCSSQETEEIIYDDFELFTPVNCEGDGVGCEFLYMKNANKGWKDEVNKYCDISTIKFTFEEEFQIDFIQITNFQDDKFNKSAKPKNVSIFGPLVEGMQYGGFVERSTLIETKEVQYIYISDEWPPISEIIIEIQDGEFTPTNVEYCGIQNIRFFGYGLQDG